MIFNSSEVLSVDKRSGGQTQEILQISVVNRSVSSPPQKV